MSINLIPTQFSDKENSVHNPGCQDDGEEVSSDELPAFRKSNLHIIIINAASTLLLGFLTKCVMKSDTLFGLKGIYEGCCRCKAFYLCYYLYESGLSVYITLLEVKCVVICQTGKKGMDYCNTKGLTFSDYSRLEKERMKDITFQSFNTT